MMADLDEDPRREVCGLPVFTGPVQVSRCQLPDGHGGGCR